MFGNISYLFCVSSSVTDEEEGATNGSEVFKGEEGIGRISFEAFLKDASLCFCDFGERRCFFTTVVHSVLGTASGAVSASTTIVIDFRARLRCFFFVANNENEDQRSAGKFSRQQANRLFFFVFPSLFLLLYL
jgi:hypothetical protein